MDCYNRVAKLEAAILPVIEQADEVVKVEKENACLLLKDSSGNSPRIAQDDTFEIGVAIDPGEDEYTSIYSIITNVTDQFDGEILLKWKSRDFTVNDDGCNVSTLSDKSCTVVVPKGPEGTLNRFIEQR